MGLPVSDIKVIPMEIGGGFGGKTTIYLEPVTALLSKITGNSKSNFGAKVKIWNFFVPISRIFDKIFFHSFGKSLICVVEKTSDDNTTLQTS